MIDRKLSPLETVNLALRVVMETGIILAFAYWGFSRSDGLTAWFGAVLAPLIAFGLWGLIDFRELDRYAEPARLAEELVISALAAGALIVAGQPALGILLALLSATHHTLVYLLGGRLIKEAAHPRR